MFIYEMVLGRMPFSSETHHLSLAQNVKAAAPEASLADRNAYEDPDAKEAELRNADRLVREKRPERKRVSASLATDGCRIKLESHRIRLIDWSLLRVTPCLIVQHSM